MQHRYHDTFFEIQELLCNLIPEEVEKIVNRRPRTERGLTELDEIRDQCIEIVARSREAGPESIRRELKERRRFYDANLES